MNPCVQAILCGLARPVQEAIAGILTAQKAVISAAIAVLQAQVVQLEILLAPFTAARDLAQAAKDALSGSISIVPSAVFAECFDLGTLSLSLSAQLDKLTAPLDDLILNVDRKLALLDELNDEIASLNDRLAFYDEIIAVIEACPFS